MKYIKQAIRMARAVQHKELMKKLDEMKKETINKMRDEKHYTIRRLM